MAFADSIPTSPDVLYHRTLNTESLKGVVHPNMTIPRSFAQPLCGSKPISLSSLGQCSLRPHRLSLCGQQLYITFFVVVEVSILRLNQKTFSWNEPFCPSQRSMGLNFIILLPSAQCCVLCCHFERNRYRHKIFWALETPWIRSYCSGRCSETL